MQYIRYNGNDFKFEKRIRNDYDFEIACQTLKANLQNEVHRDCTFQILNKIKED